MRPSKSPYLKQVLLLLASSREKGYALPLVMGIGLIMILLAQIMITRSSNNLNGAQISSASAKSLSAAEIAVTRYQSLIQNNRAIATYSDCKDPAIREPDEACNNSTNTWSNAGSIAELSGDTTAIAAVTNAAQTGWQDIDPSDASKGQFRLVSYKFSADNSGSPDKAPGMGTLVVEGRVNSQSEAATRLAVTFDVTNDSTTLGEGLWISCNDQSSTSNSGSEIQTNVKDSTSVSADNPPGSGTAACPSSTANINALKGQQLVSGAIPTPPFTYDDTSTDKFPPLPAEGLITNVPGTGVCTTSATIANAVTLPAPCNDPAIGGTVPGTYNTYHLTGSTAINFTGSTDVLTVDAPGQTVKLYLNGELKVTHADAGIVVTPGTTLIIYAHGPITLNGGSNIGGPLSNGGTPDNIQIYQYVSDELRLTGGSGTKAFIFAPLAQVSLTGASAINGAIWARSYKATGGSDIVGSASAINCANLPSGFCSGSGQNQIGSIKTWSRNSRD